MNIATIIICLLITGCAGVRFGEGPRPQTEHFEISLRECRKVAYDMAPYQVQLYREIKLFCMDELGYTWKYARYITKPDLILAQEIALAAEE